MVLSTHSQLTWFGLLSWESGYIFIKCLPHCFIVLKIQFQTLFFFQHNTYNIEANIIHKKAGFIVPSREGRHCINIQDGVVSESSPRAPKGHVLNINTLWTHMRPPVLVNLVEHLLVTSQSKPQWTRSRMPYAVQKWDLSPSASNSSFQWTTIIIFFQEISL